MVIISTRAKEVIIQAVLPVSEAQGLALLMSSIFVLSAFSSSVRRRGLRSIGGCGSRRGWSRGRVRNRGEALALRRARRRR